MFQATVPVDFIAPLLDPGMQIFVQFSGQDKKKMLFKGRRRGGGQVPRRGGVYACQRKDNKNSWRGVVEETTKNEKNNIFLNPSVSKALWFVFERLQ